MRSDDGGVALLTAAVMLVAMLLALGLRDLAMVAIARADAQTAADAAALAAALDVAYPVAGADPHLTATTYAGANGASIVACVCEIDGSGEVIVTTQRSVRRMLVPADAQVLVSARAALTEPSPQPSPSPNLNPSPAPPQ